MRTLCLAVVVVSSFAFAQSESGGVWTGYVGGWKPNHPPMRAHGGLVAGPTPAAPWLWWQMATLQSQWALQAELQRRAASEEVLAAQQAETARLSQSEQVRRAQLDTERRLAAERETMLRQQLDEERRASAEKELLAMQRLEAERAAAAAAVAKANAEKAAQAPPLASRSEGQPPTPGNDIYRWVDEEGVVHYSTRVPDHAKAVARRVGGPR